MTDVRKTIRFGREDYALLQGLADGVGVPFADLIRGCSLKFGAQHAAELRASGKVRRSKPRAALPKVDVAEYLGERHPNVPIELIRRRISLGMVHYGGQPYFKTTIPAEQAQRLEPQWD